MGGWAFAVRSVWRWDRCDGLARAGWAREKASREEAGVAGGSWGWLGMARDSEKESRLRERERAETEWGVKGSRETHACFGKWFTEKFSVNRFPYFTLRFSGQNQIFSCWLSFYVETNVCKCWKRFTKNVFSRNKRSLNDKLCEFLTWSFYVRNLFTKWHLLYRGYLFIILFDKDMTES